MNNKKSILFITPYPNGNAPSQRFRFEQYISLLEQYFIVKQSPFWNEKSWAALYRSSSLLTKIFNFLTAYLQRFILLFSVSKYDFIFIHREATPIGPPIIEFIIAKILKKKVIYDFDDAIWIHNVSDKNRAIKYLKANWKVKYICKWAYKISCGNNFLANYAKKYNDNVITIPTTIDLNYHKKKDTKTDITTIGWTGTHSTLKHLNLIIPIISTLEKEFDFSFIVISDKAPDFKLKSLRFIEWNKQTEIDDLNQIDIGIMPLYDSNWEKGKCGFKGLQYMSLGIPTIMSAVGVNKEIIENNVNGFLAYTDEDWTNYLTQLITTQKLRKTIGSKGQKTIINRYSLNANKKKYLSLFS